MKFEIESNEKVYKFDITEDPLYENVEKILKMDSKIITNLAGSLEKIPTEERDKDLSEYVTEIISKDPDKMADFIHYNNTNADFKLIMLCAGLGMDEIRKLPTKTVLRPLINKCAEILGSSADEFIKNSGFVTLYQKQKPKTK